MNSFAAMSKLFAPNEEGLRRNLHIRSEDSDRSRFGSMNSEREDRVSQKRSGSCIEEPVSLRFCTG